MGELLGAGLRPEIAKAWHRAKMSGLDPGMEVRDTPLVEVDRHSRLLVAAAPVLDRLVSDLSGTRFTVLLADHGARIVDRRLENRDLRRALDQVKAIPGTQYIETISGTNSLATAFELRKPIAFTGAEHFLEALRGFCCYGAPIVHPITRRLEGVLDVTGPVSDASALLGPFLIRAIQDIESRLLNGSRVSEQRLFAEFQSQTARTRAAVVALGENLALSNAAAMDLTSSDDFAALRGIAAAVTSLRPVRSRLVLHSGRRVVVDARWVADSRDGVLIEIHLDDGTRRDSAGQPTEALPRVVLITGEPGTGRTCAAVDVAGPTYDYINCLEFADQCILRKKVAAALSRKMPVILDNIEFFEPFTATAVRAQIASSSARTVMTSTSDPAPSAAHSALCALALSHQELTPVRYLGPGFPILARALVAPGDVGSDLRITPSTMNILAAQPWPGNISELKSVLAHAARERSRGDITPADLPPTHARNPGQPMSPLERAEREAILSAFADANGNKAATAAVLGISRSTLYQRLRRYKITG